MSSYELLLSVAEGIRRIPINEESDKVDVILKRVAKNEDLGRVAVPSSPGTVWSSDRESFEGAVS